MSHPHERLPVRIGAGEHHKPLTRQQAERLAQHLMPPELERAGFTSYVNDPRLKAGACNVKLIR